MTIASPRKLRSLTGIKPSNAPHIGNYIGAIRPAIQMTETHDSFLFIADYHALTTLRDAENMRAYTYDVAATWLACGLDPATVHLYRQSDRPEVFELSWTLGCFLATGQLERGHAYKDALQKGGNPNAGLFTYPVLMAADILLYDANAVPVAEDQRQHLELTRDVAVRVNHVTGSEVFVLPEPAIADAPLVPGLDGQKMSKSKGNAIPLFAPAKQLLKVCKKIATGSEPLEAPIEAEGGTVYEILRLVSADAAAEVKASLLKSDFGWGHAKKALFDVLDAELAPKREKFEALRADEDALDRLLQEGAARVEPIARATLDRVRSAIGIAR